jgi:membrane protease subunit (stomatin/prohibitin family)
VDILKKLMGELVDIVEFLDDSHNTIVHRFERYQNEIKYGAKLVVRESQAAVFVDQGKIADVFGPGMYTLETSNIPILSTLRGWKYGFNSPFKAEVYFVSTRQFTDLKWGTQNPVMRRDPEFGPVRLRAFGSYAMRVVRPGDFVKQIAGTAARFTTDGITEQLRNIVVSRFADRLGESRIPLLDMAGNQDELGKMIGEAIKPEFDEYGLELTKLLVENISLPPEVEAALDKRSSMGIIGNLSAYSQFSAAEAMRDAAKNPGAAGQSMGMGMGFVMAQQMGAGLQGGGGGAGGGGAAGGPPPLPGGGFFVAINGQQAGPFDAGTLGEMAQTGRLTRESLVWKQGMANWAAAGTVGELGGVLGGVPPPLPPLPPQA